MTFVTWSNHKINIFSITDGSSEYFKVSKDNNEPAKIISILPEEAMDLIKEHGLRQMVQSTQ